MDGGVRPRFWTGRLPWTNVKSLPGAAWGPQSPEKLQKSLESMQQAVERERHAAAVAEKQSRELRSRIDGTTRVSLGRRSAGDCPWRPGQSPPHIAFHNPPALPQMEKEVLKTVAMMDGVKQAIDQKKQVGGVRPARSARRNRP